MKSRRCNFLKLLLLITFLLVLISFLHHIPTLLSPTPTPLFPTQALPTKTGYLSVNPSTTSSIFYAFYEAQNPISPLFQTPLIIWLQGGPGCSSMVGNFFELGPWRVTSQKTSSSETFALEPNAGFGMAFSCCNTKSRLLHRRPGLLWQNLGSAPSATETTSLVWSFGQHPINNTRASPFTSNVANVEKRASTKITSTPKEIPRDQLSDQDLFAVITSFIELDPLLFKSRPVYFAGESYAGKFVLSCNAYYSGLINKRQKSELEKVQWEAIKLTRMRKWKEATDARSKVLQMLQAMTGLSTLHDYSKKVPYTTEMVSAFLSKKEVKKALGLKDWMIYDVCNNDVAAALHDDFMKSVKFMVEFLVKKSKVLLYQGHFDLRDSVVSTKAWVKTIKWEGLSQFLMAKRKVWRVNGDLSGYVQKWGNLSHVVVLGAGHLVPIDQALSSQAMIEDWVLEERVVWLRGKGGCGITFFCFC
uniref:Carboxypeptidase n=1 Tax=Fagus sylvatica TaxID=28930 RepID=A0A2N9G027_FAGSY